MLEKEKCTDKEWQHCRVEKMGCKGCYYNTTEELQQAISNILRGDDIESAALILKKCALENYIIRGGRVNILKVAVRQILNFIEVAKNKGILKYVKENVSLKSKLNKANKMIDEMAPRVYLSEQERESMKEYIWTSNKPKDFSNFVKQYFEKKVEEK